MRGMDGYDLAQIVAANSSGCIPEERVREGRERYLRSRYWEHVRPQLVRKAVTGFEADDLYDALWPHTEDEVETALDIGAWEDPYLEQVADGYLFMDGGS